MPLNIRKQGWCLENKLRAGDTVLRVDQCCVISQKNVVKEVRPTCKSYNSLKYRKLNLHYSAQGTGNIDTADKVLPLFDRLL